MPSYLQWLQQLDLARAVMAPLMAVVGYWAYALLAFMVLLAVYVKTRSVAMPAVLGLLVAAAMRAYLPVEAHTPAYFMMALSVAAILYRAFKG